MRRPTSRTTPPRRNASLLPLLVSAVALAASAAAADAAVDDLLEHGPPARPKGAYADILAGGTAADRVALALELRDAGGRTNLVRAARLFARAARDGDTEAQYWIARLYETGEGMRKADPEKAVYWAWTGMEGTNAACMNLLGTFYERGFGLERDEAAAADCYRQSADLGNAKGALNYAIACEYGRGVPTNPALALAYYETAARAGLPEGMFRTGLCHLYGTGTARNGRTAAGWFQRAARAGDPDGAGFLGRCRVRGMGVPRDPAGAVPWLEAAVAAGREEFRPDLLRALRALPPEPTMRGAIVRKLEAAASGDPAECAAEIADMLSDPAWGEPDLAGAAEWLERGGPAARAAAHAARQRVARASFDAAAARAESAAHASETVVLGGLRLGMPAETAARLLEEELAGAGVPRELVVRPAADGGVRAQCDLAEISADGSEGWPVREIWLSRAAVDALFGTKGMTQEEALHAVLGPAGVLARSKEAEGEDAVVWEGRRIGTQKRTVHASPEGWELAVHGPLAVFDNRSLDPAREGRAFLPSGSLTLRRAAPAR